MAVFDFKNRTQCRLSGGITSSQTVLPVGPGGSEFLPSSSGVMMAVIRDALGHEVVKITAAAFGQITVERGQDGSSPRAFNLGAVVSARLTKSALGNGIQRGAMRQISYNPNEVTVPNYFGEKISEVGVDGCTHRIWQNVVAGSAQWRIVYGDMCKDLQNYREWDWPIVEYPWPEWPTPLPGITPDMWLDASRYDYAEGVDLSYLDDSYWYDERYYSEPMPLSEIVNPVYDHVNDFPVLSVATGGAFGARPKFSREKFSGLNAFNFTCVAHKRPEFGTVYGYLSGVELNSPAKVLFLVADIDFSAGDIQILQKISYTSNGNDTSLKIRCCSGALKIQADVLATNGTSVWTDWKTLSSVSGPAVYVLRYDLREAFNLGIFLNGSDIGAAVDGLEDVVGSQVINEMRVSAENLSGCSYTPAATHTTPAYVCEFQVFDRWLTDTQITAQTELLKKKWGIS